MLTHPTYERLTALGLTGMATAFEEQRASPDLGALSFEERIGIMVDREACERDTKRLTARLEVRRSATERLCRGHRSAHPAPDRPGASRPPRCRRLDRPEAKLPDHRS